MATTKETPAAGSGRASMRPAAPSVGKGSMRPPAPAVRIGPPVTKAPVVMKTPGAPGVRIAPAGGAGAVGDGAAGAGAAVEAMARQTLVIAFIDLARFQIASRRVKDDALVEILEDYYERIADGVKPAGGRVVKFMGDGALVVFPVDRASQAARALVMLKSEVDARLAKRKFLTLLVVRLHVGEVMAGAIGPKAEKRFDVIGQNVNRTATLRGSEGIVVSAEAWGKLDAKTQKLFKARGDLFIPA